MRPLTGADSTLALADCTEFQIGLPGGEASPGATIASFSGAGLSWKLGLFDVNKATSWDDVCSCSHPCLICRRRCYLTSLLSPICPGRDSSNLQHARAHEQGHPRLRTADRVGRAETAASTMARHHAPRARCA